MSEFDAGLFLAAWLTGLAGGSGHCMGMCGGILGALGMGQRRGLAGLPSLAAAHLGRVTSYSAAGAGVGLLGSTVATGVFGESGIVVLRSAAGALILLIGLQLLLGRPLLTRIEAAGAKFWRLLAPQMRRFLPPRDPGRAFAAGALWGWLPCGLVYAELAVAGAAGGPLDGALVMFCFGLGTTVSLSALAALLHALGMSQLPRRASGALLVLFAVWTLLPFLPFLPAGSHVH